MHYCCVVLTKEFPTDEVIDAALKPFNSDAYYSGDTDDEDDAADKACPAFTWDCWKVGGRYQAKFKLRVDTEVDDGKYRWGFYADRPRTKRLFRSWALEEIMEITKETRKGRLLGFTEEDYFPAMGSRDGYLYVDGGAVEDIINFEDAVNCYCMVDVDGKGYARELWDGEDWKDNTDFDSTVKAICERHKDGYVVVVDLHD